MSLVNQLFRQKVQVAQPTPQRSSSYGVYDYGRGRSNPNERSMEGIDQKGLLTSPLASAAEWLMYAYQNSLIVDDNYVLQEISKEGYKIFDRMTDRDPHLYSVFERARVTAANMPMYFQSPIPGDPKQEEMLEFLNNKFVFEALIEAKYNILRAAGFGFGVYEIVYKPFMFNGSMKLVPSEVVNVPEDYIKADVDRTFKFTGIHSPSTGSNFLPKERYIHARFKSGLYGDGLLKHAFAPYWFKRNAWIFAGQFIERFGNPALIGRHTTEDQKKDVLDMLQNLRSNGVASLPNELTDFKILEPSHQTDFLWFLNFCNDEESKIFLFGTRTMSASDAAGAYSATEVHAEEADDRMKDLATFLRKVMNTELIPKMLQINFGKQDVYPYATFGKKDANTVDTYLDILNKTTTAKVKVPISLTEYYDRTGLQRPLPDDPNDVLMLGEEPVPGGPMLNFQEGRSSSTQTPTSLATSSSGSGTPSNNSTANLRKRLTMQQRSTPGTLRS